ncbi:P-loop containing nucleoside triphosphate hydrolase protein [Scleroderma yunnanense]
MLVLTHHGSGETASRKSENCHLAIKSLLELSVSNPGKKGSKLVNQVLAAKFIIKTYRNACTLFNPNASHFGKYTELQFTDCGRLVVAAPFGEHNFHIFYHLVTDTLASALLVLIPTVSETETCTASSSSSNTLHKQISNSQSTTLTTLTLPLYAIPTPSLS